MVFGRINAERGGAIIKQKNTKYIYPFWFLIFSSYENMGHVIHRADMKAVAGGKEAI